MNQTIIKLENLSKNFKINKNKNPLTSLFNPKTEIKKSVIDT
jgi:hypothetical protein